MKSAVLAVAIAAIQLAGCATTSQMSFNKPGANEQDYKRDIYECNQASKTSWSGGGSGLVGLAMIIGSSAAAQDAANKTGRMCMEARGYSPFMLQSGEQAARARSNAFCAPQLTAPGLALGDKAYFPPRTSASAAMLADNSRVTPEQRTAILDWGRARQQCFDRERQELQAINHPAQLSGIQKTVEISTDANLVRLYKGEISWGEFNRVRNDYNAEYFKAMSDVSLLLSQATPDAIQRANQIAQDQQQLSAERLRTVTSALPAQTGCADLQLGSISFSDCK